jgi:trk system potassium uptake protein TrkA
MRGCRLRDVRQAGRARLMALLRDKKPLYLDRDAPILPGDRLLLAMDVKEFSWADLLDALGSVPSWSPPGESPVPGVVAREGRGQWRIVVAGCGRVGSLVAEMLSLDGYRVSVIDRNPRANERLSKTFQGGFFPGMAFDLDVLEEAGIEEANAFAALTNYDNTNLMAAEVARGIFGVGRVVSRLYNPDKENTYQALGIDFICGTSLLAEEIMQRLLPHRPRVLSSTANNRVLVTEFECPGRYRGKKVARLEEEETLCVGLVTRDGNTVVASPETELREGDKVVAALLAPRLAGLRKLLSREGVLEVAWRKRLRNRSPA